MMSRTVDLSTIDSLKNIRQHDLDIAADRLAKGSENSFELIELTDEHWKIALLTAHVSHFRNVAWLNVIRTGTTGVSDYKLYNCLSTCTCPAGSWRREALSVTAHLEEEARAT